jgi:hypothetical protein
VKPAKIREAQRRVTRFLAVDATPFQFLTRGKGVVYRQPSRGIQNERHKPLVNMQQQNIVNHILSIARRHLWEVFDLVYQVN